MKKLCFILLVVCINVTSVLGKTPFEEKEKVVYENDTIHTYIHPTSGLSVLWIENQDKNKSFMLGVKTPTKDSTGVNHIIEHTVFTGSTKYPNTSLFFDANQRYPNIYMNAMTASDMTMYPFCTPYEACYKMLLNVYLDSILNPNMKLQPNSFFEEAFHYNPKTNQYGGVVYNEMKGAENDINRIIFRGIRETIFKGTSYEYDSGGDPDEIPTLTYEDFLATYNTYYYPGNMQIILYGNINIEETLGIIDGYFNKYTKDEMAIDLTVMPSSPLETQKIKYPSESDKAYIVKSFIVKKKLDTKEALELDLWLNAYLLSPNSYFQRELQSLGVKHINLYKDDSISTPVYSIVLPEIQDDKVDYYKIILDKVIDYVIAKDFSDSMTEKDTLEKAKMGMYDADQSSIRGIQIAESMLDSWGHNKEKYQYYIAKKEIQSIKNLDMKSKKLLLEDSEQADIQFLPDNLKDTINPLEKSKFNKEEWGIIVESMDKWQKQSVKGELPLIDLKKLILRPEKICNQYTKGKLSYITVPMQSKLSETTLYLDTSHISQEQLPYLFLYEYFLNESAKEESPFKAMLHAKAEAVSKEEAYKPYMKISVISTSDNTNHAEVLREARINLLGKNKKWYNHKLNNFIYSFNESLNNDILGSLGIMNMGGMKGGKRYEYEKTFPCYEKAKQLVKGEDVEWINEIRKIDGMLYVPRQVTIGINADKTKIATYQKNWESFFKEYGTQMNRMQYQYEWEKMPSNSLYLRPSNVDYILYSYQKDGGKIDGLDYIMASYLTQNYLQPHIRIQKGAYGSGMYTGLPANLSIYTYRDPDYISSMEIINSMATCIESEVPTDDLEASKADALSSFHKQFGFLESELGAAEIAADLCYGRMDSEYLMKVQQEIIEASSTDLQKTKVLIESIIKNSCKSICTHKKPENIKSLKVYTQE